MRARIGFWRGVWAGGVALAVTGIARLIELAPFPPELLAIRLFELLPIATFERLVIGLGMWAKWLVFAATTLVSLLGAGVAGLVVPRFAVSESPFLRALCHGAFLTILGVFLFLPAVGVDLLGDSLPQKLRVPLPLGLMAGALAYGFAFEGPRVSVWVVWRRGN